MKRIYPYTVQIGKNRYFIVQDEAMERALFARRESLFMRLWRFLWRKK